MSPEAKVLPFSHPQQASEKRRFVRELFDKHCDALQRFVRRLGIGDQDSLDIVQEVYLRVLRLDNPEALIESPLTYLCTIAANLVRDQIRKSARNKMDMHTPEHEVTLIDPALSSENAADIGRKLEVLKKALMELPPKKQGILLLNQYQGLSCRQIAEQTGIPFRTVQRYLNDALLYCKSRLRAYHD